MREGLFPLAPTAPLTSVPDLLRERTTLANNILNACNIGDPLEVNYTKATPGNDEVFAFNKLAKSYPSPVDLESGSFDLKLNAVRTDYLVFFVVILASLAPLLLWGGAAMFYRRLRKVEEAGGEVGSSEIEQGRTWGEDQVDRVRSLSPAERLKKPSKLLLLHTLKYGLLALLWVCALFFVKQSVNEDTAVMSPACAVSRSIYEVYYGEQSIPSRFEGVLNLVSTFDTVATIVGGSGAEDRLTPDLSQTLKLVWSELLYTNNAFSSQEYFVHGRLHHQLAGATLTLQLWDEALPPERGTDKHVVRQDAGWHGIFKPQIALLEILAPTLLRGALDAAARGARDQGESSLGEFQRLLQVALSTADAVVQELIKTLKIGFYAHLPPHPHQSPLRILRHVVGYPSVLSGLGLFVTAVLYTCVAAALIALFCWFYNILPIVLVCVITQLDTATRSRREREANNDSHDSPQEPLMIEPPAAREEETAALRGAEGWSHLGKKLSCGLALGLGSFLVLVMAVSITGLRSVAGRMSHTCADASKLVEKDDYDFLLKIGHRKPSSSTDQIFEHCLHRNGDGDLMTAAIGPWGEAVEDYRRLLGQAVESLGENYLMKTSPVRYPAAFVNVVKELQKTPGAEEAWAQLWPDVKNFPHLFLVDAPLVWAGFSEIFFHQLASPSIANHLTQAYTDCQKSSTVPYPTLGSKPVWVKSAPASPSSAERMAPLRPRFWSPPAATEYLKTLFPPECSGVRSLCVEWDLACVARQRDLAGADDDDHHHDDHHHHEHRSPSPSFSFSSSSSSSGPVVVGHSLLPAIDEEFFADEKTLAKNTPAIWRRLVDGVHDAGLSELLACASRAVSSTMTEEQSILLLNGLYVARMKSLVILSPPLLRGPGAYVISRLGPGEAAGEEYVAVCNIGEACPLYHLSDGEVGAVLVGRLAFVARLRAAVHASANMNLQLMGKLVINALLNHNTPTQLWRALLSHIRKFDCRILHDTVGQLQTAICKQFGPSLVVLVAVASIITLCLSVSLTTLVFDDPHTNLVANQPSPHTTTQSHTNTNTNANNHPQPESIELRTSRDS